MKRFLKYSFLVISVALNTACERTVEPSPAFTGSEDVLLVSKGHVIMQYDPLVWQLGQNDADIVFRASRDDMKEYVYVTCDKAPVSVGQKFDATVTWSKDGDSKTVKGEFEVSKAEKNRFWLWCGKKKTQIGVTVCVLNR